MTSVALYSPEEISEMTRNKLSPFTLKRLARDKKIDCVRGERNKILFTEAHVNSLIESMTQKSENTQKAEAAPTLAFKGTSRSRKLRQA